MEGNFFRFDAQRSHGDSFVVTQKPNLVSNPMEVNENGCFDCNICLDTAHDPVVTLCGHLFCWPCIYKWLDVQSSSVSIDHQQNCPVCKSNISIVSLVPLYGRGMSSSSTLKETSSETSIIPQRPSASASSLNPNTQHHQTQSPTVHHYPQYYPRHHAGFTTTESTDLANAVMMSFLYPVIGMLGDMVYTRIFGTFLTQPYQNSHAIVGNSHRMMQLEKSLHRVSIFFFCCILLCLFLF